MANTSTYRFEMLDVRNFGRRVRDVRLQLGLTQRQVADAVGVSEATVIGRIERGQQIPRLDTAVAIARVLKVGLGDLLQGHPKTEGESQVRAPADHGRRQIAQSRLETAANRLSAEQLEHLASMVESMIP